MDWHTLVDVEQAIQFVHRSETTWASGEEFTWVVTELGTDSVIGATSCRVHGDSADFGYVLNRGHWNKGLATEVASALVEMVLVDGSVQRIWATCDVENLRSRRVLEKAGLLYEGLLPTGVVRPNISTVPRAACVFGRNRAVSAEHSRQSGTSGPRSSSIGSIRR